MEARPLLKADPAGVEPTGQFYCSTGLVAYGIARSLLRGGSPQSAEMVFSGVYSIDALGDEQAWRKAKEEARGADVPIKVVDSTLFRAPRSMLEQMQVGFGNLVGRLTLENHEMYTPDGFRTLPDVFKARKSE